MNNINIKVIIAVLLLSMCSLTIFSNSEVYNLNKNPELKPKTEINYNEKAQAEQDNQSIFRKITNLFTVDGDAQIELKNEEVTILNTELDDLDENDLITLFGAKAYDENKNILPITVDTTEKSDNYWMVNFSASSGEESLEPKTAKLYINYDSKPIITVKKHNVEIKLDKYKKFDQQRIEKYIIKKAKIKAKDKEDGKLDLTVDLSNVLEQTGEYKVRVTTKDLQAQESVAKINLIIS